MRLNDTTDLALRIMIYAASVHPRRFNIDQIVQTYALPRSTIMKVVSSLTQGALLSAQRGRGGGLYLAREASEISVGDIIQHMETDFDLVECMRTGNRCTITESCKLIPPLIAARKAFIETLGRYSVADVALAPSDFGMDTA
ncbi:Rrf2 family transcriptional regulator (plasmid) [Thioclava litoralis]|uniref:Rrf2 family transcriptional regulator n=1 Tax=Thioclava litoralis TaxID=3076557 RepID=A0ABZ1E4U5_9RHOB|nr:Rrf2 family transcriptional regulator [Thioclava sp. FTW29]